MSAFLLGIPFLRIVLSTPPQWRFLEHSYFQLLGQISYGIYLFHGVCLFWIFRVFNTAIGPVAELNGLALWSLIYLAGVFAFFFSFISYRFVETRFLR